MNIKVENNLDDVINESISIDGKEDLTNQLYNLFKEYSIKNQILALEEAQYNGILSTKENIELLQENQTPSEISKHTKRIKSILSRGNNDMEEIVKLTTQQANSIQSGEKAYHRGMEAKNMLKNTYSRDKMFLSKISDIFISRSKELNYKND